MMSPLLGLLILLPACFAGIPKHIEKCRSADVVCIARTTTQVLQENPNGNPELGLRKIEPIHLKEILVGRRSGQTALNLNFKLLDVDVFGMSKANVTKVVGFKKDPRKSKFEMYIFVPEIRITGAYEANGRILLLPIVGNGTVDIKVKGFKSGVKIKFAIDDDSAEKNKMSILKMKVKIEPESMTLRLDNLFNGDKVLGEELNKVINENWRDVWTEMESGINEGYSDIIRLLLNEVFQVLNYSDFYID